MTIIGLDAHSATFTMAFLTDQGNLSKVLNRDTSAENLINLVKGVKGPTTLVVEESHIAQWIKDMLTPFVDTLIVCDPKENRWIARDEFIDDRKSAIKLAELYLSGYLKEIPHPDGRDAILRSLFLHYYDITKQGIRFKNKLKGYYRQVGIKASGKAIYEKKNRETWLVQLHQTISGSLFERPFG
jgi:hypothetical protein